MTTQIVRPAAAPKVSTHVGQVGDRVRVEGCVRKIVSYGGQVLHIIHDIDGNEFTCRRTKSMVKQTGSLVTLEANILGHSVYSDVKRTDLSSGTAFVVDETHAFRAK